MDARTRKLAGLVLVAVGVVVAVVGGLADQIGIGANDEGEMGGKQVAALVVGLLLIVGGAVLATVLAKDGGTDPGSTDTAAPTDTPATGTPAADSAEAEPAAEAEPVEATDSGD